jgi:hypothetical protein
MVVFESTPPAITLGSTFKLHPYISAEDILLFYKWAIVPQNQPKLVSILIVGKTGFDTNISTALVTC